MIDVVKILILIVKKVIVVVNMVGVVNLLIIAVPDVKKNLEYAIRIFQYLLIDVVKV